MMMNDKVTDDDNDDVRQSKVTEEAVKRPRQMKRSSLYFRVLVGVASLWGMTMLLLQLPGRLTDLQAWYLHVLPFYSLITLGNFTLRYNCSHCMH